MKVESPNDVSSARHLDQSATSPVSAPALAKVDELAQIFNQEVLAGNQALRATAIRIPPSAQLTQLYDQMGYPIQESLAAISRRFRHQLQHNVSVDKWVELAEGDPARAFVVLKHLQVQLDSEARPSEAARAREAIALLSVGFKGEIQAGLAFAGALLKAGGDPQERQALRTLYYASIATRQSLATIMQALLGEYGGDTFSARLGNMRKALADDIATLVSAMTTSRLRTLLLALQSCGQLGTVLASCHALIERLGLDCDAVSLLQRLLGYAGSGIDAGEVLRLGHDLGGHPTLRQVVLLNALYPLMRDLPLALWPDSRVRQNALDGFLAVMGELERSERKPSRFAGDLGTLA
ncbi:TyeA family type III secretion system gatekeeper subunit [Pseudomonas trivialis]|uniref:TyeA family type III secretion system gatekeeper subunit n=1 Tax=Pseudomonas trivialis TaxID=200450 RepID=UPI0030CFB6E4